MTDFDALTHGEQLGILLEIAQAATANYDLPPDLSVAMINLSENATYKVEAPDGRRWALRIHRDGYHSRTAIQSELAWLVDLRQSGVVLTPVPLAGKDGELIQSVGHARLPRPRNVVLSHWETGVGARHRRRPRGTVRGAGRGHCPHARARPAMAAARPGSCAIPGISRPASAKRARIGDAGATAWVSMPRRRSCSAAPST